MRDQDAAGGGESSIVVDPSDLSPHDAPSMRTQELLEHAINWPGTRSLTAAFAVGVALLLVAGLITLSGRFRWFTRGLALLGCLVIMAVCVEIRWQTITEHQSESVTVTRPRHNEAARIRAGWALAAVPSAVALGIVVAWITRRQWLRAQIPRLLKLGHRYQIEGNYPAALAEYSRVIQIAPHLGETYCARGRVYKAMGDTEHALADFDRAIDHDPRHSRARLERAITRIENNQIDPALDDLAIALIMRANDPECHLLRGICLYHKGELDNALSDFHRVLKLTNHSDFADPARAFIKRVAADQQGFPDSLHSANGAPPALPQDSIKPLDPPL